MVNFFNALLVNVSVSSWMVTDTFSSAGHIAASPFSNVLFPE